MTTQTETRYEILSLNAGVWRNDILGDTDQNSFTTAEEAEAAIVELKNLGSDWAAAEYKVAEITPDA